ncbi:MAG: serine hydrolase [Bacteroidetes bacterium]|nr:serine hydrolase [Bacteroidota bacterium]
MTRWIPHLVILSVVALSACRSTRTDLVPEPPSLDQQIALVSISTTPPFVSTDSPTVVYPNALVQMDSILIDYILAEAFPGAVVAAGVGTEVIKMNGYGRFTYDSQQYTLPRSIFDLASLTKVVGTTTATMLLYESGDLDLEAPVARYLSAYDTPERESITIYHLLTHTSGLPAFRPFHQDDVFTSETVLDSIFSTPLISEPGEEYRYSDFGMISLALAIEEITGESFDSWCERHIFTPLAMTSTGFRSTGTPDSTIVPTEVDDAFRQRLVQGEVHDETAWILGGVAGHAGLFSNALDLSNFAQMMVQGGVYDGQQFLQPETINQFTAAVDTSMSTRALGWDTRNLNDEPSSAGIYFGPKSYGHTGFTGTSLWIDPDSKAWVILLTNRVYPTRERYDRFWGLRGQIADQVYQALFWPINNDR